MSQFQTMKYANAIKGMNAQHLVRGFGLIGSAVVGRGMSSEQSGVLCCSLK